MGSPIGSMCSGGTWCFTASSTKLEGGRKYQMVPMTSNLLRIYSTSVCVDAQMKECRVKPERMLLYYIEDFPIGSNQGLSCSGGKSAPLQKEL